MSPASEQRQRTLDAHCEAEPESACAKSIFSIIFSRLMPNAKPNANRF